MIIMSRLIHGVKWALVISVFSGPVIGIGAALIYEVLKLAYDSIDEVDTWW